VLDSNEYILGIPASKPSCAQLMDQLGDLTVYVPSMVIKEERPRKARNAFVALASLWAFGDGSATYTHVKFTEISRYIHDLTDQKGYNKIEVI